MRRSTATLVGFTAVLMWALLALLSTASGKVPPFQLAAGAAARGGEHLDQRRPLAAVGVAHRRAGGDLRQASPLSARCSECR